MTSTAGNTPSSCSRNGSGQGIATIIASITNITGITIITTLTIITFVTTGLKKQKKGKQQYGFSNIAMARRLLTPRILHDPNMTRHHDSQDTGCLGVVPCRIFGISQCLRREAEEDKENSNSSVSKL